MAQRSRSRSVVVALAVTAALVVPLGSGVGSVGASPAGGSGAGANVAPANASHEGFDDVPGGRYFTTPVNWMATAGVTKGVGGGNFGPQRAVTRAQFITWLYRLSGDTASRPSSGFPDENLAPFAVNAIRWAKDTGVTGGVDGGRRFGSNDPISRLQIVLFLWRSADSPTDADPSGLTDVPASSMAAVNWAVEVGVTTGVGTTGRFEPARGATRAESITMLYRNENPDLSDPSTHTAHDAAVRMNEIQSLGTHNSYRFRTPAPLFNQLLALRDVASGLGVDPFELDYANRPLDEQFGRLGARQIELDVFADPAGGKYANRVFNAFPGVNLPVASGDARLNVPGYKVLHIQDLDYSSHCVSFVECLTQVRDWSLANPSHFPIMILVEVKSDALPDLGPLGSVIGGRVPAVPPAITAELLDDLDDEILSVFDEDHVITPDSVRGAAATLREVVTNDGWPTLGDSRGKVLFGLDNAGPVRDLYIDGRPSLDGRMMFADVGSTTAPGAAFFKVNTPSDSSIPGLIADGFIVRTRADGPYVSLLRPNASAPYAGVATRRAAWQSGATWLSSDYLEPTDSAQASLRGNLYTAFLPAGGVARCNPVAANPLCDDRLLLTDSIRLR